jgi:hypothetical protein
MPSKQHEKATEYWGGLPDSEGRIAPVAPERPAARIRYGLWRCRSGRLILGVVKALGNLKGSFPGRCGLGHGTFRIHQ